VAGGGWSQVRPCQPSLFLVLERQRKLGPERHDFPVLNLQIHFRDFCDPQVPERLGRCLYGACGGILPRGGAHTYNVDDPVDARLLVLVVLVLILRR
jgi:hypothetical protein